MIALDLVELAGMSDLVHLVGTGIDALCRVVDHGAVFPAAFPEFVQHLQVFIGLVVTPVMFDLFAQAHGFGRAVQIPGDDVPAHTAAGQMVQCRHATGE